MNSKNIKKSLNAKLNSWIESIDDEEIKSLIKNNTIISGGAIVSLLTGETPNDYDVYFKTQEVAKRVAQYYISQFNDRHQNEKAALILNEDGKFELYFNGSQNVVYEEGDLTKDMQNVCLENDTKEKEKYKPIYLTNNAITLTNKIQLVIRFYGNVDEIHSNYDFTHCTCAWSSWDNKLLLPQKALECIINKELFYQGSKYPFCSIVRTRKFLKRGWTINAGQYLKMCLQLNELDLKNPDVLREQLVGVDSLYFNEVIKSLADKKQFKTIDNSYLFEIIDRIF